MRNHREEGTEMKNAIIATMAAVIYRNACVASNSDTFAIGFGALCMAGCVYFLMREIDKRSAKRW